VIAQPRRRDRFAGPRRVLQLVVGALGIAAAVSAASADAETSRREPTKPAEPRRIEVLIQPALAPGEDRWRVSLAPIPQPDDSEGPAADAPDSGSDSDPAAPAETPAPAAVSAARARDARQGVADTKGKWVVQNLAPGWFRIEVRDANDNLAHSQPIEVEAQTKSLWVDLSVIAIHGHVWLGRRVVRNHRFALAGAGALSINFRTDAEGRFEGFVPTAGEWVVEMDENPWTGLRRQIAQVAPDGGRVDINLPAASARGMVVDEHGAPQADASVTVTSGDSIHSRTDASGNFVLRGLADGERIEVVARSADGRAVSSVARLEAVDPGGEATEAPNTAAAADAAGAAEPGARIVVWPSRPVGGLLRDAIDGAPIGDAEVIVCGRAPGVEESLSCDSATTGVSGKFEASLAGVANDVLWIAQRRGYALSVGAGPAAALRQLSLSRQGGVLELRTPHGRSLSARPPRLVSAGAGLVPFATLYRWASLQGLAISEDGDETVVRIPDIAAGTYGYCDFPAPSDRTAAIAAAAGQIDHQRCGVAVLNPGGEVVLRLPARDE
jgi:hypothetical protein